MTAPWLFLQLTDGAFPAGGFAHSQGLEAALELGAVDDVETFLDQVVWQAGRGSLPFVRTACERPDELPDLDATCDATLPSRVANRASRAQGRAMALAAARVFDGATVQAVAEHARRGPAHHAPVFGALFGALGMTPDDAQVSFLHGVVRSVVSAAVRLGAVGPLEAQRVQAARAARFDEVLRACAGLGVGDAAQTAPLLELFGALHDRLDGRLFQS